ncbi:hypothetical protein KEM54_000634 [Ascosphaera aggregata]|nr:hypothetical protein KEM54_000634 [Ascosphaera aggregata]
MEWASHSSQSYIADGHKSMHRCLSCGKFCNWRALVEGSSLCINCSASWHEFQAPQPSPSEKAGPASALRRTHPSMETIASSPLPPNNDENFDASTVYDAEEKSAGDRTSQQDIGLCARCWAAEGTSILYNSPVCDECFRQAREKRKRYQPPTPSLQPGKRLTRVCDTCRRKRKRCQHRRIVDENHSEADPRPRRNKKRELRSTSTFLNSPCPRTAEIENRSKSEVTPDKTCRASPRRQSARQARQRIESMTETCLSPPSSLSSLLEVVNSGKSFSSSRACHATGMLITRSTELEKESPPRIKEQEVDHAVKPASESDNQNLKLAIQDSVNIVHAREMARVVSEIQDKMADINDTVQILKLRIEGWMRTSYGEPRA